MIVRHEQHRDRRAVQQRVRRRACPEVSFWRSGLGADDDHVRVEFLRRFDEFAGFRMVAQYDRGLFLIQHFRWDASRSQLFLRLGSDRCSLIVEPG